MIRAKRLRSMPRYRPKLELWENPNYRLTLKEAVAWFFVFVLIFKAIAFFGQGSKPIQSPRQTPKAQLLRV